MGELISSTADRIIGIYESAGLLSVPVIVTGIVLFLLQKRFPVVHPFRGASATSAGWTLLIAPVSAVIVALEFAVLSSLFDGQLSWDGFETVQTWPIAVRVLIGLLVVDFVDWWSHKLRHRVPLLWRFHTIHHSAPHMTFWASLRSHPVDVIIGSTVLAIPFLIIRESAMVFGLVIGIRTVLFYFHHSNVRVRLGRLDLVLVTPQWHRIHHSTLMEHYDTNFGATLTIWDRLFGTAMVPEPDDFPPIGLDADLCPPDAERITGVPRVLVEQVIFPFRS
jgi:sterol desaturase/sphingolipid hydroxylase (fatty acid hydroxylase superfamily)